ncbi:uncharacterized protein LOC112347829 [Selaginella moellendorffii]|uniref:uncharacterized protein LOC112347829 n=1 Tax=Selaginella moellendorffii TaxID=88036 RepID=UPI000D1C2292|nr:uncharacterized protein LOC112347829 [Selaginella moellendorffii]|eukprot:XP_024535098.1 uncharacterized protein LOC112347829 [Selaginella moellendorffii]
MGSIRAAVREDLQGIYGALKEDVVARAVNVAVMRAAIKEDLQARHDTVKEDVIAAHNQSHGRLFHIPLSGFGWLDQVVSKAQSGAAAGSVIHRNDELFSFLSGIFFLIRIFGNKKAYMS